MTITTNSLALAGAISAGLCAGAASATTLSFDFTGATTGYQDSLTYTSDDVSLTVTGRSDQGTSRKVATWTGAGLGVWTWGDWSHAVDSLGPDDIAVLEFSEAVTITQLSFSYIRSGSSFDLLVDTGAGLAEQLTLDVAPTVTGGGLGGFESTLFAVEAGDSYPQRVCVFVCFNVEQYSEFKLAGLTVETAEAPAPVPLPAGGLLLASALAGGAAAVRRRRAA